jgi:hypothetical protein
MAGDWRRLAERIEDLTGEIETRARRGTGCGRLMNVPGIGPIDLTAMVAASKQFELVPSRVRLRAVRTRTAIAQCQPSAEPPKWAPNANGFSSTAPSRAATAWTSPRSNRRFAPCFERAEHLFLFA